jgi:hypothetical protein
MIPLDAPKDERYRNSKENGAPWFDYDGQVEWRPGQTPPQAFPAFQIPVKAFFDSDNYPPGVDPSAVLCVSVVLMTGWAKDVAAKWR